MRNRRPDLNGIIVLDKPIGWTSADCCRFVRKLTDGAKVGHAGTLDPLATGVLVLCLGSATRLIPRLMSAEKRYRAEIDLAHTSETDDLESAPRPVLPAAIPSAESVRAACQSFIGRIMQAPPAHSAVWVGGERAYARARRGETVEPTERAVEVHAIDVLEYDWPRLVIDVRCGRGTYIRSLARDIGRALGVGGMLRALRRAAVGEFGVEQATPPAAIEGGIAASDLIPAEATRDPLRRTSAHPERADK